MQKVFLKPLSCHSLHLLEGSVEYSGCHYKDGEEIAGKSGTWEASIEKSVKADKVKDEKKAKKFKVVKKLKSKNMKKVKAKGRQSKKLKKENSSKA